MKSFKIVFYKSERGQLVHAGTCYRRAVDVADLMDNPPGEFSDLLMTHTPIHGWAEVEESGGTVFVIFAFRTVPLGTPENEVEQFSDWLNDVKPSDFSAKG